MVRAEPLDEAAAVAVFSALVDPTRRSVLDALARQGPATVSELADRLPVTRQAVAKHFAQLVDAGLVVAGDPQGRRVPYHLRSQPMRAALAWLRALANQWDDRLHALTDHLDAAPAPLPGDPAPARRQAHGLAASDAHGEPTEPDVAHPAHDRPPRDTASTRTRSQQP